MKYRFLSVLGVLAFCASNMVLQAQDYDDIYYDGSSKVKTEKKSEPRVSQSSTTIYAQQPTKVVVKSSNNYQADRDVDEYNRRGISEYDPTDTLSYIDDDMAFANTQRIERFYNPDIVIGSNDEDLIELYYDDTPSVNLIVGTNWGYTPRVGWGIGYGNYWYGSWSDPFYDPFYDPYYPFYRPWYYGWHTRPFNSWYWPYYGWYSGWYGINHWGHHYGWGSHYYGWGGHHYGWGHSNHHHWDGGHGYRPRGRVAGDGRSLLNGRRSTGSVRGSHDNGTRAGISGLHRSTGSVRNGSMSSGRTRPSTGSAMDAGRSRTSSVGNIGNRATNHGSTSMGSGSMRNSRPSTGSASYGSRSRSSSSGSYSSPTSGTRRSNWGGSSSSGRSSGSYSGSSRSSGSYSGSHSSGGYSGGSHSSGGSRGSSGGGGGRRH